MRTDVKEKARSSDKTKGETRRALTFFFFSATIETSQIQLASPLNRYSLRAKPRGRSTQTTKGQT